MQKERMPLTKTKIIITGLALIGLAATLVYPSIPQQTVQAQTTAELEQQIASLEQEIEANKKKAADYAKKANELEAVIAKLNTEIATIQKEIEVTELKIDRIRNKLVETREKLEQQKLILATSLREHYKIGNLSTIELFANSANFSDFFNQKEYLNRVRSSIQESSKQVAALEDDLETQKQEQDQLLQQQTAQRNAIQSQRSKKDQLLAETRGQQASFSQAVEDLVKKQKALNAELVRRSRNVVVGGGSYPWSNAVCVMTGRVDGSCPDYEWKLDGTRVDPWGYYLRNCTSYVAWKFAGDGYPLPTGEDRIALGNGGTWYYNAPPRAKGQTPKVGAAASFDIGFYGHVAYVEAVYENDEILISEYNFVQDGVKSQRVIPESQVTGYVYPWKL